MPAHGGDTCFACMYHAYDALSPEQKASYESLTLVNSVTGLRDYLHEHGEYSIEVLGSLPAKCTVVDHWCVIIREPAVQRSISAHMSPSRWRSGLSS